VQPWLWDRGLPNLWGSCERRAPGPVPAPCVGSAAVSTGDTRADGEIAASYEQQMLAYAERQAKALEKGVTLLQTLLFLGWSARPWCCSPCSAPGRPRMARRGSRGVAGLPTSAIRRCSPPDIPASSAARTTIGSQIRR
jgi:hypothetical protein